MPGILKIERRHGLSPGPDAAPGEDVELGLEISAAEGSAPVVIVVVLVNLRGVPQGPAPGAALAVYVAPHIASPFHLDYLR